MSRITRNIKKAISVKTTNTGRHTLLIEVQYISCFYALKYIEKDVNYII